MDFEVTPSTGWGGQLNNWLEFGGYRDYAHLYLFRRILATQQVQSLLDVGCGNGCVLQEAQEVGIEAVGVDYDDRIVAYHTSTTGLKVLQQNIVELSLAQKFDLVICHGLLEHLDDPNVGLQNLRKVTAPGGKIVLSVPAKLSIFPLLVPIWYFTGGRYKYGWQHMVGRTYTTHSLKRFIVQNGLVPKALAHFKSGSLLDWGGIPFSQALGDGFEGSKVLSRLFGIMLYAICEFPDEEQ